MCTEYTNFRHIILTSAVRQNFKSESAKNTGGKEEYGDFAKIIISKKR